MVLDEKFKRIAPKRLGCAFTVAGAMLTTVIVFSRILSAGNTYIFGDVGSDTMHSYVPFYTYIIDSIRGGTFDQFLSEYGFGVGRENILGSILDPFSLGVIVLGCVFGSAKLHLYLVIMRTVFAMLNAWVCYRYLCLFSKRYYVIALSAYIFAFNGFFAVWGHHYFFSCYTLYMVCILHTVEVFLRREKNGFWFPVILTGFLSMLIGPYFTYMAYLPTAIYALIRCIQLKTPFSAKGFFCKLLSLLGNILIGFCGGMLIAVGGLLKIAGGNRVTGDMGGKIALIADRIKMWYFPKELFFRFQTMLSPNLNGVGWKYKPIGWAFDYYNAPQLFFSVFFLLFGLQYIFTIQKRAKTQKDAICNAVSVILIFLAIYNLGVTYIWYALTEISQRCLFTILPFFAIVTALVLEQIIYERIISWPGLVIGLVLSIVCLMQPYVIGLDLVQDGQAKALISIDIILLTIGAICLIKVACASSRRMRDIFMLLFSAAVFINVTVEMDISSNHDWMMPQESWNWGIEAAKQTENALNYIKEIDPTFYRIEKNYWDRTEINDSLVNEYPSVTMYDSNVSGGIKEYFKYYLDSANSTYMSLIFPVYADEPHDLVQYSQLGVKYILSKPHYVFPFPQDEEHYEHLATVDGIEIYQNLAAESFTTFYQNVVTAEDYLQQTKADRIRLLSETVMIDAADAPDFSELIHSAEAVIQGDGEADRSELLSLDESWMPPDQSLSPDNFIAYTLPDNWYDEFSGEPFLELAILPGVSQDIQVYFDEGVGTDWVNSWRVIGRANEEYSVRRVFPRDTKKIVLGMSTGKDSVTVTSLKLKDSLVGIRPAQAVCQLSPDGNDSRLAGTISTDTSGVLLFPFPYDSSWRALVDGSETKIYHANSGFMAIKIQPGVHTVRFEYHSAKLGLGAMFFLAALALAFAYAFGSVRVYKISGKEIWRELFSVRASSALSGTRQESEDGGEDHVEV